MVSVLTDVNKTIITFIIHLFLEYSYLPTLTPVSGFHMILHLLISYVLATIFQVPL